MEEIRLFEIDKARTPQYPATLEISTPEVECGIGGVRGEIAKARLLIKDGKQVAHMLSLAQEEISRLISVSRSGQQRMEIVSTRIPLEIEDKFVEGGRVGKKPI